MAIKHPTTGKPELVWETSGGGVIAAFLEQQAKYRRGNSYTTRSLFAFIRPAYNINGVLDSSGGWVVTRNSFDEIREFSDLDDAKVYIKSLFALEQEG